MQILPLFLLLVSSACSLAYGVALTHQSPSGIRSVVKTSATACLAMTSFISAGPFLLTVGLALGAAGDFFLSLEKDRGFLPGLGAFLAGHICFVVLFFQFGQGIELLTAEIWRALAGFGLFFLAAMMTGFLWSYLGNMKLPVLAYIAAITAMGLGALTMPLSWALWMAIPGALFFIMSDTILSLELFVMDENHQARKLSSTALWFLYWGGQLLILLAFML